MTNEGGTRIAFRLERTSRIVEIMTTLSVLIISPFSVAISPLLGIPTNVWLFTWQTYVFIFVVMAMVITLVGFGAASHYRLRAKKIKRSSQEL